MNRNIKINRNIKNEQKYKIYKYTNINNIIIIVNILIFIGKINNKIINQQYFLFYMYIYKIYEKIYKY